MSTDPLFRTAEPVLAPSPPPATPPGGLRPRRFRHEVPGPEVKCEVLVDVQTKTACGEQAVAYVSVKSELVGTARVPMCHSHKAAHDARSHDKFRTTGN